MPTRTIAKRAAFVALLVLVLPALADQPNIGLVYSASKFAALEQRGKDKQQLYRDAIQDNGGLVVVLPQTDDDEVVTARLEALDGILLPGGIDVDPQFYAEERHERLEETDAALDQLEFSVLDHAKEHKLPMLGVCRGHQVLNVYYGGSLIQDIPSEHKSQAEVIHRRRMPGKEKPVHHISIEHGSLLHQLLGATRIVVNTYHHQAVKKPAPGFVITARADDGIVEAIEYRGDRFILGVQFHPEKMRGPDPRFNAIFKRFVEEARKARARRTGVTPTR